MSDRPRVDRRVGARGPHDEATGAHLFSVPGRDRNLPDHIKKIRAHDALRLAPARSGPFASTVSRQSSFLVEWRP
jgi:hypothetical protein